MSVTALQKKSGVISLRTKLLIGFTVLFSAVFAAAFYWFYGFTTEKTMSRLFTDLRDTASGTSKKINVEELEQLYQKGQPSTTPNLLPGDPRYKKLMAIFGEVHNIEPRAWPYVFVVVQSGAPPNSQRFPNSIRTKKLDSPYTVFLADLWSYYDPSKAGQFLQISKASPYTLRADREGVIVDRPLYDDGEFGSWISSYVPLKNQAGRTVAILGLDFEADYVREIQKAIRDRTLIAFGLTYFVLLILVYLLSDFLTQRIVNLTKMAAGMGEGNYKYDLDVFAQGKWADEITTLANVFTIMVGKVREREETLKQQVAELKVEIDQVKRQKQVTEIVESDFFQDLQLKAQRLRDRNQNKNDANQSSEPSVEGTQDELNK